eukprot:8369276-Lingulodinium_polyedra.AAC.1
MAGKCAAQFSYLELPPRAKRIVCSPLTHVLRGHHLGVIWHVQLLWVPIVAQRVLQTWGADLARGTCAFAIAVHSDPFFNHGTEVVCASERVST